MTTQKITRTSQPQGAVGVDWSNPLTRGLVAAYTPATQDPVTKTRITNIGATIAPLVRGAAVVSNGTSSYLSETFPAKALIDICTILVVTTPKALPSSSVCTPIVAFETADKSRGSRCVGITSTGQWAFGVMTSNGFFAQGVGAATLGKTQVVVGTFNAFATKIIVDSSTLFSGTVGTGSAVYGNGAPTQRFLIGKGDGVTSPAPATGFYDGSTALALVFGRELSPAEIKSLSANPWQIFQPIERQIFIGDSAVEVVLADGLVTVDNATQVNTASTATIQQTHLVGVANSAQANTASSVGASQSSTVLVTVDSAAQTNTASASSINQTHRIICAAVAIDNVASSSAIVQTHLVGAASSTVGNTASGVLVTQGSVHSVGAANASQTNTASTVAVRVTHAVGAASSTQANTASNAAVKQTHLLTCAAAAVDNVASASLVVQTHLVGAASAAQANTASTVAVGDGSFIAAFGRTGVLMAESRTGQIPTEIRVGSLVVELRSGSI